MAENPVVVDNPYGLYAFWTGGDFVSKGTLIILVIMSLLTWYIMITKFFDQRKMRLQANQAEKEFWTSGSISDAVGKLKGQGNPIRAMAETGKNDFEHHETNKAWLAGAIDTSEWITQSLDRTSDSIVGRMQAGLPVLASVGSTAPFVGLFGTVWGIMNSFIGISEAHTTNLAVVAPGIAEALLATALGLVAAIPAVVIYNHLTRTISAHRALLGDASAMVLLLISREGDRGSFRLSRAAE